MVERRAKPKPTPPEKAKPEVLAKAATASLVTLRYLEMGPGRRRYYAGQLQVCYAALIDNQWKCYPLDINGLTALKGVVHRTEKEMHDYLLKELSA